MSISQAKKVNRAEMPDFRVSGPPYGLNGGSSLAGMIWGRVLATKKQILVFSVHQTDPNVQPQGQSDQFLGCL